MGVFILSLFAISDLHLSLALQKPMTKFGDNWIDHHLKIKKNWLKKIKSNDIILIGGDISWAMKLKDALIDLEFLHDLPGKKVLIRGNHDFWWSGISKLNSLFDDIFFIQNNFIPYNDYAICGSRGWICPGDEFFEESDIAVFKREKMRIELSLKSAIKSKFNKIIFLIHYPPTNDKFEKSEFMDLLEKYKVEKVIYGHLHGPFDRNRIYNYKYNNIEYYLTSCDFINFSPVKIF
jgi:predicted phosphohydrolase